MQTRLSGQTEVWAIRWPLPGGRIHCYRYQQWPDIATAPYCRTGGQLWKNNGNGTFTNIAAAVGYNARYMPGDNGQNMCMWNVVPEDYDNDGDDDIITRRNGTPRSLHLIENRIGQDNNWTAITLLAPQGVNKSCIGARVHVWAGGTSRMRDVYAGRGNASGQQPFALTFGLGSQTEIDSVTVVWPDAAGTRTTVVNPPVNRYLQITGTGLSVGHFAATRDSVAVLKCYPNPAKDFILLQLSNNARIERVLVYDATGRAMTGITGYDNSSVTWYCSIANLLPGHYFVQVVTEEGAVYGHSFMKME